MSHRIFCISNGTNNSFALFISSYDFLDTDFLQEALAKKSFRLPSSSSTYNKAHYLSFIRSFGAGGLHGPHYTGCSQEMINFRFFASNDSSGMNGCCWCHHFKGLCFIEHSKFELNAPKKVIRKNRMRELYWSNVYLISF